MKWGLRVFCVVLAVPIALAVATSSPEPALNGRRVGYSIADSAVDVVDDFAQSLKNEAAQRGNGERVIVISGEGDPLKQVINVESMIAQGVDAVIIQAYSDVGWRGVLARARKAGIPVFNHSGFALTGATQNVLVSFYSGGYEVGKAAARWLDNSFGGEGKVAILGQFGDSPLALRTAGMRDGITRNSKAKVVAEVEAGDRAAGAAGAANALAANSDLRVILALNDDVGLGALTAAEEARHSDPRSFFIGGSDGLPDALGAIQSGTSYQVTWGYLFGFSATQTMRDVESVLRGRRTAPTRVLEGMLITPDTLLQYRQLDADPLAPGVQGVYSRIMYYSDEAVVTGDAVPPR
jgi:ribose transport system substrate-binding protein